MSSEADRWDEMYRSGEFREHWDSRHAAPYLAAMVAAGIVQPDMRTLDIGCGGGRNAIFLATVGCESAGIDWSATALRIAGERAAEAGVEVDFREGSALAMPFEDGSIDFAIDNGCLHGFALDTWSDYAAELARVLAPGGLFLLVGGGDAGEAAQTAITADHIDGAFSDRFERGPFVPVVAISDAGQLDANMCLLRRTR